MNRFLAGACLSWSDNGPIRHSIGFIVVTLALALVMAVALRPAREPQPITFTCNPNSIYTTAECPPSSPGGGTP